MELTAKSPEVPLLSDERIKSIMDHAEVRPPYMAEYMRVVDTCKAVRKVYEKDRRQMRADRANLLELVRQAERLLKPDRTMQRWRSQHLRISIRAMSDHNPNSDPTQIPKPFGKPWPDRGELCNIPGCKRKKAKYLSGPCSKFCTKH